MKKMKILLACLLAAAMLLPMTACGKTDDGVVTLNFLRLGNDEAEKQFWLEVIESYEATHDNVKINYDDAAIGDAMDTKLTSGFTANAGPDIIGHGILSIASRVEAGQYLPITDYYNSWSEKDDLMSGLVDLGTYGGQLYGIAYLPTPYVFAYRKDLLEQAGYNHPPKTWAELAEYAEKLTVKEDGRITQAGFAFPTSGGNMVELDMFAFSNGGRFADANGNPTLNTPENLEALQFVQSLVADVSIPYNNNETNPFMAGNAAMTFIDNVKLAPMFSDPAYKDKIALAMPPANEGHEAMTFSGCRLLFIGKDCKNPDAAFDFISYAVSKDVVLKRAEDLKAPVVLNSLVDTYASLSEYNDVRAQCVANGIGMPITTWSTTFQKVRNELLQNVLNGGNAADVLAEAQAKLEQEIANAAK